MIQGKQLPRGASKSPRPAYPSMSGMPPIAPAPPFFCGFSVMSASVVRSRDATLPTFAIDDLTAEEEEELLKYLAFLRSRKPSS